LTALSQTGSQTADRPAEAVEIEIDDRRRVERQHLRQQQPADDAVAERLAYLGAGAGPEHQRHAAQQRRHRRHQDGPEAQHAGAVDRLLGRHAWLRSASSAKSTSMMPFFLTMPINRMMPISAMTL